MDYGDPLDSDRIRADVLAADRLWRSVTVLSETGSTNVDLAAMARAGADTGTVLITDFQAAGRGRLGRTWSAPPGSSVALSVLLRPERDPASWTWLPLLAGLAVAATLRKVAGVPAVLKWPNDVLVHELKLCGILAERVDAATGPACVLGIGINVHLTTAELPVATATSLTLLRPGEPLVRNEIIAALLAAMALRYHRWEDGCDTELVAEYQTHCATLGRRVKVLRADGSAIEGEAVGVDPTGRLRVRSHGRVETFAAGDVLHLR